MKWAIKDVDRFRKITRNGIHIIKNHRIWIKIREEIVERIIDKFSNAKRDKSEIKNELNKIYDYILQSNDTPQKIRKRIHNLTRDRDRNDLINRQIKGFSFHDFEDDR